MELISRFDSVAANSGSGRGSSSSSGSGRLSFFFYQPKIWKVRGRSEEKGCHAVNLKQKSTK
jgi:hypothetical protein